MEFKKENVRFMWEEEDVNDFIGIVADNAYELEQLVLNDATPAVVSYSSSHDYPFCVDASMYRFAYFVKPLKSGGLR